MTTMTLAVPNELKEKMDSFPEINWSAVARQAFMEKIEDLDFLQQFKKKSKLTKTETIKLGKKVNKELSNKLRKLRI